MSAPTLNDHQPGYAVLAELHRVHQDASKPLNGDSRSWYVGYLGELEVGNRLNALRAEGYTVLHGVQPGTGDTDVDHLVITRTGFVYAINTKHHRNKKITAYEHKVLINGQGSDHLRNSRSEIKKVLRHLDKQQLPISGQQGVLAFVAPSEIIVKKQPDVWVLKGSELVGRIKREEAKRKQALPLDATVLTEPTFWRPNYDFEQLAAQDERLTWFAELQKHQGRREARRFFGLLTALGIGAAVVASVLHVLGVF